jgi:hypothetical protein
MQTLVLFVFLLFCMMWGWVTLVPATARPEDQSQEETDSSSTAATWSYSE